MKPEDLEDQAPRSAYKADGKLREVERDVAKRWKNGSVRIACIGVENQTAIDLLMPLRVIGYDGAGIEHNMAQQAASILWLHLFYTLVLKKSGRRKFPLRSVLTYYLN